MPGRFTLRPLLPSDFPAVRTLMNQGRLHQQALGFTQWLEGYPSDEVLESDLQRRRGFLIMCDGVEAGYAVIDTQGDAEYDRLAHIWQLSGPYAVVHRFVLADFLRGKGEGRHVLGTIENLIKEQGIDVVRFDTGVANKPMQRLLEGAGYKNLGEFTFVWGPRLAYEKKLD